MNIFGSVIYVVVWVFAVQQPNGKVEDRVQFFPATFDDMSECASDAIDKERGAAVLAAAIHAAGGKMAYSRVICVPVPPRNMGA